MHLFLLHKFKHSLVHGYGTYEAKYYVNLSSYFVFTNTLTYVIYWQAHFDANYCNKHTTAIG
jgi:hypothetical protein